jgi:hypothetical protein
MVLIASFCMCATVHAAGLETESQVEDAVEASMESLKRWTIAEFVDSLRPIWNKPDAEINALKIQIEPQRTAAHKRFGNTLGVQFVDLENVEDTLIQVHYIEKFEKAAMRWTFNFYKPMENWYLTSFVWDQNIDVLFDND